MKTIKDSELELPIVIAEIQAFLEPVFNDIVNEDEWQKQWNPKMKWHKNASNQDL